MLLNAENISQIKFKTKRVKLQKADAEINVALLSAELIAEAKEMGTENPDDLQSFGMKMLMEAVVDDAGKPVFTSKESFESLPPTIQNEIMNAVWDYNGLSQDSIKELAKN